jgi:hypothetical protein
MASRRTFDENESPPLEGCRGGLFRPEDPPLKAKAFFPLPGGDFRNWLRKGNARSSRIFACSNCLVISQRY